MLSDKKRVWSQIKEYVMIAFGLLLYALAWKWFLIPHEITGGGATGISAIVLYATGIPISVTYFIINAILLGFAIKLLGFAFSLRTIYGVCILTLWLALPIKPLAEFDAFVSCVLGGILAGVGMGLTFINNGSSGGTDIIAKIVNKYRNITLGRALLYCDVIIICSSYFLPEGDITKIVYGLIVMAIMTYTVDLMVNGDRQSVQFFIFSKKHQAIADAISGEIQRGVTFIDGEGYYSKEPIKIVTVLVRRHESNRVFKIVKEIDSNAFVSQSSAIGVYGQGFDPMGKK